MTPQRLKSEDQHPRLALDTDTNSHVDSKQAGTDSRPLAQVALLALPSLLLLLVAGAGCPAAHHLAPDLLHKLWVLLLHLLCKLLAPVDAQETNCAAASCHPLSGLPLPPAAASPYPSQTHAALTPG